MQEWWVFRPCAVRPLWVRSQGILSLDTKLADSVSETDRSSHLHSAIEALFVAGVAILLHQQNSRSVCQFFNFHLSECLKPSAAACLPARPDPPDNNAVTVRPPNYIPHLLGITHSGPTWPCEHNRTAFVGASGPLRRVGTAQKCSRNNLSEGDRHTAALCCSLWHRALIVGISCPEKAGFTTFRERYFNWNHLPPSGGHGGEAWKSCSEWFKRLPAVSQGWLTAIDAGFFSKGSYFVYKSLQNKNVNIATL